MLWFFFICFSIICLSPFIGISYIIADVIVTEMELSKKRKQEQQEEDKKTEKK